MSDGGAGRRPPPSVLAIGVVAAALLVGLAGSLWADSVDNDADDPPPSTVDVVGTEEPVATEPPPSTSTTIPASSEPPVTDGIAAVPDDERTALTMPIGRGMAGTQVQRVQERLAELKFNPGPVDGVYGSYTIQAVWAYQKLVLGVERDEVSEVLTDEMWQRMQDALDVEPRRKASEGRATTNHTEIYLPEQVVIFFLDDEPALIAHISSGTEEVWREVVTIDPGEAWNEDGEEPIERGIMAIGHTPGGVFRYNRFVDGRRESILGGMWNPAYFNRGIAIHGAQNVPNYLASHSCIRINMYLSEIFWDYIDDGDQVFVWNHDGDEPEAAPDDYPWNRLDPDAPQNTTTTTTTTIATTTTTLPEPDPTEPAPTQPEPTEPAPTEPAPTTVATTVATTTPPTTTPPTTVAVTTTSAAAPTTLADGPAAGQ